MRTLAGSLVDGVLADAILISPRPPIVRKQGMSFQLPAIQKLCQDACSARCYIPTSLPQEQAAKTSSNVSVVTIQVFSIMHS